MTGFARGSVAAGPMTVTVELRSVNSRYLDLHFKMPEGLRAIEPVLRRKISAALNRGKVEVLVRWQADDAGNGTINRQRLAALITATREVQAELDQVAAVDPLNLLLAPGVLESREAAEDELAGAIGEATESALKELTEQRQLEGKALADTVRDRAARMRSMLTELRQHLPELRQVQRQRLLDRLADAGIKADEKRLEEELVYVAQRADVDEEMDRIDAHLDAIETALGSGKPCGRRLDFLMQELNREANTLSSKSTALSTTNTSVEFKLLIEQMREQIQNIE
jgi:uncharacterized protein (TIGR00255 family)